MTDAECVSFLQWALPHLNLRWAGYRKVRRQVCKRIRRRLAQLELADYAAYRAYLQGNAEEWHVLAAMCPITISRFYRDWGVWDTLHEEVLPELAEMARAAQDDTLRCWSLGCASGEEPYTLAILWRLALAPRYPELRLRVLATDVDRHMVERARAAQYPFGTLRDLPPGWVDEAFEPLDGEFRLQERFREAVDVRLEDVRRSVPTETFRVILCRNAVFTYFDEALQKRTLQRILARLARGGALVLGRHERLPPEASLKPWFPERGIYRHLPPGSSA
jgi:chemotaxis protein methyltransferase CheR